MNQDVQQLIDAVKYYGFEYIFQKYYGLYEAMVVSNKDPEKIGRVQLYCPTVGQNKDNPPPNWVLPVFSSAGAKHGEFNPPEVGDCVRIAFELGDPSKPQFYIGGWYGQKDLPDEFQYSAAGYPERRGFKTRLGHHIVFSDDPDKRFVRILWHNPDPSDPALSDRSLTADSTKGDFSSLTLDDKGGAQLINKDSSIISMDAEKKQIMVLLHKSDDTSQSVTLTENNIIALDSAGDSVELNSANKTVTVLSQSDVNIIAQRTNIKSGGVYLGDGATFSGVKGEVLMTWLSTHTHTAPPSGGPTTPPIVPPPGTILSQKVKTA